MPDDVVVPRAVEHKIRELHPPEEHDARIEEARGYYRVLREDRKKELLEQRTPRSIEAPEIQPTPAQKQKILVRKRRKHVRRRKVRVYPGYGPGTPIKAPPQEGQVEGRVEAPVEKGLRLSTGQRVRFRTKKGPYTTYSEARVGGRYAGHLGLSPRTTNGVTGNHIDMVRTEPMYGRQGIATGLYRNAHQRGFNPVHSTQLSEEGARWRKKMGGTGFEGVAKAMKLPDGSWVRLRTYKRPMEDFDDVEAMHRRKNIGYLSIHSRKGLANAKGEVSHVMVKPEWRRKGIGRGMWETANRRGLEPEHSKVLSRDGRAWAEAVGKSSRKRLRRLA